MTQRLQAHPEMVEWLERRVARDRCPVAEDLCSRMGYGVDRDTPNYLHARLDDTGKVARMTYSTDERMLARGVESSGAYLVGPHRVVARPGKVAQAATGIDDMAALEDFTHALTAWLKVGSDDDDDDDDDYTPRLVSGAAIRHWYHQEQYCGCDYIGSLANSCMRYDECQGQFTLYERHAQMAILTCPSCEGLRARSIVWTADDESVWFDRVYGSDTDRRVIKGWAQDQGWLNAYDHDTRADKSRLVVSIDTPRRELGELPWMDTMAEPCPNCRRLTVSGYDCDCEKPTCERCGEEMTWENDNDNWDCQNQAYCGGCGDYYCEETCPNGCERCTGCQRMIAADAMCDTCARCPSCDWVTRLTALRYRHGACPHCGDEVAPDMAEPITITARWVTNWHNRSVSVVVCPECRRDLVERLDVATHIHCQGCEQALVIIPASRAVVPVGPVVTHPESLREHFRRIADRDREPSRYLWECPDHASAEYRRQHMLSAYNYDLFRRDDRYRCGQDTLYVRVAYADRDGWEVGPTPVDAALHALVLQDDAYASSLTTEGSNEG